MTPQQLGALAELRRARDLIDREHASPLDVPTIAARALMSPAHFPWLFRSAHGETPHSYLMTRRIERAMALLRAGTSVTDACVTVGCTSLGSFSSRFTELVGETPTASRRRAHDAVKAIPTCVAQGYTRPVRTASSRNGEATRAGAVQGPVHGHLPAVLQHHRQRRRRVDRVLRRRTGPDGPQRRALGGVPVGDPGDRRTPGLQVVLSVPHAGRSEADGDALQELLTKGVLPMLVFRSDDVDATFEKVRASGAEVVEEPIDQAWGPRDCAFRDPSGNTVRVAQAPPA